MKQHTAFAAETRAQVDAFRAAALEAGGTDLSMWVRSTIGWARRDGVWMAVHEHTSDPMDFGTGMARTDLEP